jgi:hypothetical protein
MRLDQFTAFLAECMDPDTPEGAAFLTPARRAPDEQDQRLAQRVAQLAAPGRHPLSVDTPELLPPCF